MTDVACSSNVPETRRPLKCQVVATSVSLYLPSCGRSEIEGMDLTDALPQSGWIPTSRVSAGRQARRILARKEVTSA